MLSSIESLIAHATSVNRKISAKAKAEKRRVKTGDQTPDVITRHLADAAFRSLQHENVLSPGDKFHPESEEVAVNSGVLVRSLAALHSNDGELSTLGKQLLHNTLSFTAKHASEQSILRKSADWGSDQLRWISEETSAARTLGAPTVGRIIARQLESSAEFGHDVERWMRIDKVFPEPAVASDKSYESYQRIVKQTSYVHARFNASERLHDAQIVRLFSALQAEAREPHATLLLFAATRHIDARAKAKDFLSPELLASAIAAVKQFPESRELTSWLDILRSHALQKRRRIIPPTTAKEMMVSLESMPPSSELESLKSTVERHTVKVSDSVGSLTDVRPSTASLPKPEVSDRRHAPTVLHQFMDSLKADDTKEEAIHVRKFYEDVLVKEDVYQHANALGIMHAVGFGGLKPDLRAALRIFDKATNEGDRAAIHNALRVKQLLADG